MSDQLKQKAINYFKEQLATVIQLPVDRIEANAPLEKYGIDSIMVMQITTELEKTFGSLSKTLFFEYQNIRELTDYFLKAHRETMDSLLNTEEVEIPEQPKPANKAKPVPKAKALGRATGLRFAPMEPKGKVKKEKETDDIAIIGLSGQYPDANNIREFWQNLRDGKDCVTEIPPERWDHSLYFDEDKNRQGTTYGKWGGFLNDVDCFDPLFFNIAPLEAEVLDPQERIFLQCVYGTIEDAGYTRETLTTGDPSGYVGVYVGVMYEEYQLYGAQETVQGRPIALAGSPASIANRVSWFCNFHGPSVALDTMCSSSLTSIHLACQSLKQKECEVAIAGGVNVSIHPNKYLLLGQGKFISSKGKCESFGEGGDGYVPGEGVGAVLLKPKSKAIADEDQIYGIIRATAINHGGKTNGYSVPNPNAQANVIGRAFKEANINPRTVSYIEAHGTGTALGDPIEITGLNKVFREYTKDTQFCSIGSAKSNIGHCESAAGIAGVTKVLLQLKHRQLVPSLHSEVLNPYIDFKNAPFTVQRTLTEWKRPTVTIDGKTGEYPRIAGVSSFGAGGSNAHILIEEYVTGAETAQKPTETAESVMIVLSARTKPQLRKIAENLRLFVEDESPLNLPDLAYTLQVGREAMKERFAMLVTSMLELRQKLLTFVEGEKEIQNSYRGKAKNRDDQPTPVESGEPNELLRQWVNGTTIAWSKLYGSQRPKRITLPTYPFAKERYWVPEVAQQETLQWKENADKNPFSEPNRNHDSFNTLTLVPQWKRKEAGEIGMEEMDRSLLLCDFPKSFEESLKEKLSGIDLLPLRSEAEKIETRYQDYAVQLLEIVQQQLAKKSREKQLIQLLIPASGERRLLMGLFALLQTAQLENPKLIGQIIGIDADENPDNVAEILTENSLSPKDQKILYREGKRYVADWQEANPTMEKERIPWRENGIYLITGGVGGLGLLFAEQIAKEQKKATLILTGRSKLTEGKQAKIEALKAQGLTIDYQQVDVTQPEAVQRLFEQIRQQFGTLHGIIHSAGVTRDGFIFKKRQEELREVLAPKVAGTVNLDRAAKDLPLDFMILFSSMAGVTGNAGQVDYATANAFMDAWSEYRNEQVKAGTGQGKTLSINWPLWKEGGMRIDRENEERLLETIGLIPMTTKAGISAFYQSLNREENQVMVMEGDTQKLRSTFLKQQTETETVIIENRTETVSNERLQEKTLHRLKSLLGKLIKLSASEIDADEPLESYGIDSVLITQLNLKLEPIFGELSKTLFFEYQTLEALTEYLTTDYQKECLQWTGLTNSVPANRKISPQKETFTDTVKQQPPISVTVSANEPIAIIGLSGKYSQAENLNRFWENLKSGKNCVTEIPEERWSLENFFDADPETAVEQGKSYSKWGAFVDGFADFDSLFFNISPLDAINMDPQERLFVQSSWAVLEDAGYTPEELAKRYNRKVGVFAGITKTGFDLYAPDLWKQGEKLYPHTSFSSVANRISYLLNLQGPSMPIDTMCSSSLTAIHEACKSLHLGECAMAIAGGVNLYLHPSTYIGLCAQQMLSVDGQCKSFGEGSNGFVPGEGVGTVLLKPLSLAIKEQDNIQAVIRATGINHGGKVNGYTVPNPTAQGDLIGETIEKAGLNARDISYIEAHGTGTELGDPIEITGLTQAFRKDTTDQGFCAIGSVKSNMGHLEAAAGISGVTKVVLQMRHGWIAPSLHAKRLNPNINFSKTPFVVQQELAEWKRPKRTVDGKTVELPRIAGISSFGAGGSNAHVIIEEYIPKSTNQPEITVSNTNPAMIVLSAKSEHSLREQAQQLLDFIGEEQLPETALANIAWTLQTGRVAMENRLAMTATSLSELKEKLTCFLEKRDDWDDIFQADIKHHKETLSVLTSDEDLRQGIKSWILKGKQTKLLDLWVKGLVIDWHQIHGETTPRRISLPTYPFEKQRHWIPKIDPSPVVEQTAKEPVFNYTHRQTLPLLDDSNNEVEKLSNPENEETTNFSEELLIEKTANRLKHICCDVIRLDVSKVEITESLENYGIDSIIITRLNQKLSTRFGQLSKTLFYEYRTLKELAEYFVEEHREACQNWTGLTNTSKAPAITPDQESNTTENSSNQITIQTFDTKESTKNRVNTNEPIAIIGLSGRYPQAANTEEFWENLKSGKESIVEIPEERWSMEGFFEADQKRAVREGKSYSKWGGFLDQFADFDPLFFNISPRDAINMDPQERLFIESCWEVLENAGYTAESLTKQYQQRVGVFAGITKTGFELYGPELWRQGEKVYFHTSFSSVANRVSWLLDLQGPSMPIDTMCSSSLTAIHEACEHLRREECEMAIAGGVNLYLHPSSYIGLSARQMLSIDGRCKSFGEGGNGFVPGEGVGTVLLKPLNRAIEEQDHIHAIIRGSSINHGGRTSGYTVPNPTAQGKLIREALDKAGIDARMVSYVEAHGTGTELGDPIEITGLSKAFRKDTDGTGFCAIGSAKSNIGHLEAAAGIAGVTKVILQMKTGQIAPSLNAERLNPNIHFEKTPFVVQRELSEWKRPTLTINGVTGECPRIATVSSFGAGGSNANVVIEEFMPTAAQEEKTDQGPHLILLSSKTGDQLNVMAQNLHRFLLTASSFRLADLAFTLQVGREEMAERLALIVHDKEELKKKLNEFLNDRSGIEDCYRGQAKKNRDGFMLLTADEDMGKTVDAWINKGKFSTLLDLWVKGLNIDWNRLYKDRTPRRMPLPTYPFVKERYWLPEAKGDHSPEMLQHKPLPKKRLGTVMLAPKWQGETAKGDFQPESRLVILCGGTTATQNRIQSELEKSECLLFQSEKETIEERFSDHATELFETVQAIFRKREKTKLLIQIITFNDESEQPLQGLLGLLRTAQLENPTVMGQLIALDYDETVATEKLITVLKENGQTPQDQQIRYRQEKRQVKQWNRLEQQTSESLELPWRERGVYLITGGAGGLGLLFAKEITTKAKEATLILTGRSPLNNKLEKRIEELNQEGATVLYRQVDMTDKKAVVDLLDNLRTQQGNLHGIIHSAGVIRDNFIIRKSKEEFLSVLAPKVTGTAYLDEASKGLDLDFFVLFSSISGMGNAGQADYATANAFMDAFSGWRNQQVEAGKRQGRTLSINWPLWKNGGMHISEEDEKVMTQNTGMIAMRTTTGLDAFYQSLMLQTDRMIVMEGYPEQIRAAFANTPLAGGFVDDLSTNSKDFSGNDSVSSYDAANNRGYKTNPKVGTGETTLHDSTTIASYKTRPGTEAGQIVADEKLLKEKTLFQLKRLFGNTIKIPVAKLEAEEELENYGIDSIVITQLNQDLSEIFGDLSKTLFYEYQTLAELTDYLTTDYSEQCRHWTGLINTALANKSVNSEQSDTSINDSQTVSTKSQQLSLPAEPQKALSEGKARFRMSESDREPVAIIGMHGRYPQANSLESYWENLKTGKDCITEIPEERWPLDGFFHADPTEAAGQGKSYSKWGGFVDGFADFDPLFFNISPREAINMDPQERLFVESCWALLEDAGYTGEQLTKRYDRQIGVFAGITKTGFNLHGPDLWRAGQPLFPHTSFGSVANRVSWLLNLQGPSMPIDTMCSSSLTAIHEACENLHLGNCEMAIAGGVNLYLHPSTYTALCGQLMLSSDGRCKSFGEGGNGFVPGEGVGTVLLKRLSEAIADRDNIHAIIRGTNVNHGGKVNGYTVPNPMAQAKLIRKTLDRAGIHARTVSYLEAHGTGTKLGDPIEITGLSKAFQQETDATGFCAIGSAKSNIGHLEAAAGIAGVMKIILQMKHKTLVPSLHAERLNPNINFSKTPFVVQQKQSEWKRPKITIDGELREFPRIAGISSFGAGGSNAHIILEEYTEANREERKTDHEQSLYLIPLAAKNEDRLKRMVENLNRFLSESDYNSLFDIAYTLQTGREAMEERVAFLVDSMDALKIKLSDFLNNQNSQEEIEGVYRGQAKRNREVLSIFGAEEELQAVVEQWTAQGKVEKLANLWVKGLTIDWSKLYGDRTGFKISLPTYPFMKNRYWLPKVENRSTFGHQMTTSGQSVLVHPLVHRNDSDFSAQRFSSTFTGREPFLADHVVMGSKVLPGVAYAELARAALVLSGGFKVNAPVRIRLKNIVWTRPIRVNEEPETVRIELFQNEEEEVFWEIYQDGESVDEEPTLHCQGSGVIEETEPSSPAGIDLEALRSSCDQKQWSADRIYETFRAIGIEYGATHQAIQTVYTGPTMALAKLSLSATLFETGGSHVLHPGMMDSALQASLALLLNIDSSDNSKQSETAKAALPFALQELEILSPCQPEMWAMIRYSEGSGIDSKVRKLDVDLCDEAGQILVQMKGFASRVLGEKPTKTKTNKTPETLMLEPCWQEAPIDSVSIINGDRNEQETGRHLVLVADSMAVSVESVENRLNGAHCVVLKSESEEIADRFTDYSIQTLEAIQKQLRETPKGALLVQIVIPGETEQQLLSGLSGLLQTARLERTKLIGQLIEIDTVSEPSDIVAILRENWRFPSNSHIRYQQGKRLVANLKAIEMNATIPEIPWKDRGIYLITGGGGGLGLLFAKEITQQIRQATIILTGRSDLDEKKRTLLEKLRASGSTIEYRKVDVTQKEAVRLLISEISENFGNLNGVIHSAGVLRDNFILKKEIDEARLVLAPKVAGTVNLDQATNEQQLDFFVLFSSMSSMGNVGQADYAMANGFLNDFAAYRNNLVATNQRFGKTLSINWPLWKEGGMHVTEESEKLLTQNTGMIAMRSESGIEALYRGLSTDSNQIMVMEGYLPKIKEKLLGNTSDSDNSLVKENRDTARNIESDDPTDVIHSALKQAVSDLLQVELDAIDPESELSEYGFDSITLTELSNKLNGSYNLELNPTLFFEYSTIATIAQYLLEEHRDRFVTENSPVVAANETPVESEPFETERHQSIETGTIETIQNELKQIVSDLLRVESEAIDPESELSEYGFDSITLTELSNKLNRGYNLELNPTLFFEYSTIAAIAQYLLEEHQDRFVTTVREPVTIKNERSAGKRVVRQKKKSSKTMKTPKPVKPEPLAIVGMSGQFPMAEDLNSFWKNLEEGRDCITEIPKERWDWREFFGDPKTETNKTNIKWGGFLEGIDQFDPLFFGIAPREAQLMDPQQRLLMIHTWKAIEDAGYATKSLSGTKTAIFVGTGNTGYGALIAQSDRTIEGYSSTGMVPSVGPNRMSYLLNLHGPSEPIETACSSSLVAIHRAVVSINDGSCDMAIVGGINTIVTPDAYISFSKAGMLCEDGRCKTFSDKANGYVRGEGVGILFLKKLSDAKKSNDHIYGLIRGSAENHGGRANSLTAPNPKAQTELLKMAYERAGVDPSTVTYIEAHGTGTNLGDPIEINGLKNAFRGTGNHCGLGSVKTNIGHLELSAGIAGVIKVLLQLKHKTLCQTLHCETVNPYIDLENSPFYLIREKQPWKVLTEASGKELPRRAGVSSFGFGGVNAHVVLEEYIDEKRIKPEKSGDPQLIVLSAKNEERLKEAAENLHRFVTDSNNSTSLSDMAYTLLIGRDAMEYRLAMVVNSHETLRSALENWLKGTTESNDNPIPVFTGNTETNTAKPQAEPDMAGKDLKTIARHWVAGGDVSWEQLYQGGPVQRVSLPTYPFEQRRCWADPVKTESTTLEKQEQFDTVHEKTRKADISLEERVTDQIAKMVGISVDELNPDRNLDQYGFDSILQLQLLQLLQAQVDRSITLERLRTCRTIREVITLLPPRETGGSKIDYARFPELIHLNDRFEGRPVFWIHGGLGGVETYREIARHSSRPFYGIQPRGWMTDRSPLYGIHAMAAYYIQIMQSVQPTGPYDLGGYSLGGVLAYEITRQLQELGEKVESIVMLDSYGTEKDNEERENKELSEKTPILRAVNMALLSTLSKEPEKLSKTLVHRDELDLNQEKESFLKQLLQIAQDRGLTKTEAQLKRQMKQSEKIQGAYDFESFRLLSLPNPEAVTCHYFRNESGLFYGELEPYFSITADETVTTGKSYWKDWEEQLPNLQIRDLNSSNHMMLLSEPEPLSQISQFCRELYNE